MLVILKRSVFARFGGGYLSKGTVTIYNENLGSIMMNPKSTNPVWLKVDAKKTFTPMEWEKVK
jgi:hypothetical protein